MTAPLLKTKLHIPRVRPRLVRRPRLVQRLNAGLHGMLTLVSAPAGFGKTTLLSEWAGQVSAPVAWLSLDEDDNGLRRFLTYLVVALRAVRKDIGEGLLSSLQGLPTPPAESVLSALINEMDVETNRFPLDERGVILVLDDYHLIDSQAVHKSVDFLIDHLPAAMHVVVATRVDPPFPLARLRARGQLVELRQADLRFTRGEIGEFLDRVGGLALSRDDVDALATRTEGWIAGLQMATLSMQGREDLTGFVDAFGGSHRFVIDYLAEEVLSQQENETRAFLLQTAILDRMCDSLCNAVTGREESQALLERLERDNLFVVPLDDERRWYRYHRLFRDVLLQRLRRTRPRPVPTLHLRASTWHEEQGVVTAAIDHALQAGSVERAAKLIDGHADALWGRGEHAGLLRWMDGLSEREVRAHPRLSIIYALVLFTAGRNDEALSHLEVAEKSLDASASDQHPIRGILDAARAFVTFSQGDLHEIVRLSRHALDCLPAEDRQWRSIAAYTMGLAQRLRGDPTGAEDPLEEAVTLSSRTGNHYVALIARLNLARLQSQRGHLRRAARILEDGLRNAEETGIGRLPAAGLLSAEMGSILTEWNELDEAVGFLERGTDWISRGEDVISLAMSYGFLARALSAQGDLDRAQEMIQSMAALAEAADVGPWISNWVLGLRLRMFAARADLASADRLAERAELTLDEEPTYPREMAYGPLVQLHIAQGRPGATLDLLERLLRTAETTGRMGRVISTLALRACALAALGDVDRAVADAGRALSLAEPEGYVRVFVELGPAMARLLRHAATRGIAPEYARQLLAAFDAGSPDEAWADQPLIEPLTERELEVLRCLASDLTMEEIGRDLFVARSTIRSHAKSIYGKLNVLSRREAVRRAQTLHLLR